MLWLGGDRMLATFINPLKLMTYLALGVPLAVLLMLHKTGLLGARAATRPLAKTLDLIVPVLTMGVFNGGVCIT